jgi:type IV fimbrial biogenesis protein FimT
MRCDTQMPGCELAPGHRCVRRQGLRSCIQGLVLLELLVAIAVLAILAGWAAPNFSALMERMRVRAAINALRDGLHLARAEAISRGGRVVMARLPHLDDCQSDAEGARQWRCGWTIHADADDDGRITANDELLHSTAGQPGIDILQTSGRDRLPLSAWGQFNGLGALSFRLRSRTHADAVGVICIAAGGRIQAWPGEESCPG